MSHFFSDDMRRNPYPIFEQMRAASPVFHYPVADLWMIFDYEGVKRALTDHAAFSSLVPTGAYTSKWFIFLDPPRHTELRALVTKAFRPNAVSILEPRIRELTKNLLDAKLGEDEMDITEDLAAPLPMMVISEMMGADAHDWRRFKRWADGLLGLAHAVEANDQANDAVIKFTSVSVEMDAYLTDLIGARKSRPQDDLITRLLEAEVNGGRLSHEDLLGFFQLLLIAGSETTTNLIGNAILCFLDHPAELKKLRANPALLTSAIEEVLRYRSPVQAVFRMTTRDIELPGGKIPSGHLVLPMIGSANRDPKHFESADQFDINRDPNHHIAFGHGGHFCLGAALARLEARIALGDFLTRIEDFSYASSAPWAPRKPFHVHGPESLKICFQAEKRA